MMPAGLSGLCALILPLPAAAQSAFTAQVPDSAWSLNPDMLARIPARELQIGSVNLTSKLSAGVKLREDRDEFGIPDLGSPALLSGGFDAGSVAQDIQASSNPALVQLPRKSSLRMNWLKFDTPEYRLDVTQHASRMGMRFHHLASGLRIEAERRFTSSTTQIFVGVRLVEDRRFDPTVGCFFQSGSLTETRSFCGFRLRVGI